VTGDATQRSAIARGRDAPLMGTRRAHTSHGAQRMGNTPESERQNRFRAEPGAESDSATPSATSVAPGRGRKCVRRRPTGHTVSLDCTVLSAGDESYCTRQAAPGQNVALPGETACALTCGGEPPARALVPCRSNDMDRRGPQLLSPPAAARVHCPPPARRRVQGRADADAMRTTVLLAAAAAALVCGANAAIHASAGGGDRLEPEPQSLAEVVASRLTLPACFWTRTCGSTPRPATSPPRVTGRAATTVRPAATDGCEGLGGNPRPDAQTISQAEWNLFERGVKALRAKASRRFSGYSVYEEFTRVHRENALHRGASFLMWHRVMLFEFEKELNIAVPGARIPAFDWSQWSRNLLSSSVFSSARMGTSMSSGRFSGWSSRNGAVRRQINTRTALHSRGMIDSAIGVAGGYPGFNNWLEGGKRERQRVSGAVLNRRHSPRLTVLCPLSLFQCPQRPQCTTISTSRWGATCWT
jgi:Common central domain of tyrosinase